MQLLLACRGLRLFAFGFLAVMLATYLTTLGLSEGRVGALYTLTLLGDGKAHKASTRYRFKEKHREDGTEKA